MERVVGLISKKDASVLADVKPSAISMWSKRYPLEFRSVLQATPDGERINEDCFRAFINERLGFALVPHQKLVKAIAQMALIGRRFKPYKSSQDNLGIYWPADLFRRTAEPFLRCLKERSQEAKELAEASSSLLSPFGEPLMQADLAFLRWVSGQHENSFSDWLAYVLDNQMTNGEIADLLGVNAFLHDREKNLRPLHVQREPWVRSGHENSSGRVDVLVQCTQEAIIVIETKRGSAESADTRKQQGYYRSLQRQGTRLYCILLVTQANEAVVDHFNVVFWRDFTLRLRRWVSARSGDRSIPHTYLAILLGFVSAVERGILGLSLENAVPSTETIDYLRDFVKGVNHG